MEVGVQYWNFEEPSSVYCTLFSLLEFMVWFSRLLCFPSFFLPFFIFKMDSKYVAPVASNSILLPLPLECWHCRQYHHA